MALPGVVVISGEDASASSPTVEIGTWFLTGFSEKGPSAEAVLIKSMGQYRRYFGDRVSYGLLYDALDTFFREGGSRAYVGRVVGPEKASATVTLKDASENTLTVTAASAGEWGNSLTVVTSVPEAGTFKIVVKLASAVVDESPKLSTNAEAVSWASTSEYIRLTDLGKGDPVAVEKTLSGGKDDHASATEENWKTALNLFTADLGPGQVSAPGRTTATAHENVGLHCEAKNRIGLLDGTDTPTVGTLTSQAATLRALGTARYLGLFAPWVTVPGVAAGTTRTVPPSAVVAGVMARNDSLGLNPNDPASGLNGVSRYAVGTSQSPWSDADRETLNDSGVNVVRVINGNVEIYGFRTLVNYLVDDTWQFLSNARLDAFIKAKSAAVGERFVFRQIGKKTPAEFGSALEGEVLLPLFEDEALFGDTFSEAGSADIGDSVNTEETLGEGKLRAVIRARMSPYAEVVEIEVVKEAI